MFGQTVTVSSDIAAPVRRTRRRPAEEMDDQGRRGQRRRHRSLRVPRRDFVTRCNGRSGSSSSCWSTIRGGSSSPPITRTARPSRATPRSFISLMDRDERARWLERAAGGARGEVCNLPGITRELHTARDRHHDPGRAGALLGLADRGHLGAGAVADVAVYTRADRQTAMFRSAHLVFKDGELVVRDGEVINVTLGPTPARSRPDLTQPSSASSTRYRGPLLRHRHFKLWRARADIAATSRTLCDGAMPDLKLNGVAIVETFAEAFPMAGTRIIITAPTREWAPIAARTMTGFATSVIACGAEAGIERELEPAETLDGRPGVSRAPLRHGDREAAAPAAQPRRPMRADEPRLGLLRRPRRRQRS